HSHARHLRLGDRGHRARALALHDAAHRERAPVARRGAGAGRAEPGRLTVADLLAGHSPPEHAWRGGGGAPPPPPPPPPLTRPPPRHLHHAAPRGRTAPTALRHRDLLRHAEPARLPARGRPVLRPPRLHPARDRGGGPPPACGEGQRRLMRRRLTGATAAKALSVAVYVFLLAPLLVVVLASFNSADFLSFPPRGFSLRWYRALWESEVWGDSFRLSLLLTAVVTPLALIIGTLAAYALVRYSFPGKGAMATLVMAPLVMPQIVLGIALLN